MKVHIDEVLAKQSKTRNWLSKETGITYTNICKLCKGETSSIHFDKIDKICHVLNCDISDILSIEDVNISRIIAYQNKIEELTKKNR